MHGTFELRSTIISPSLLMNLTIQSLLHPSDFLLSSVSHFQNSKQIPLIDLIQGRFFRLPTHQPHFQGGFNLSYILNQS